MLVIHHPGANLIACRGADDTGQGAATEAGREERANGYRACPERSRRTVLLSRGHEYRHTAARRVFKGRRELRLSLTGHVGQEFGDGAVAQGEFHESLNLAALWKLPVIYICENNRYAMGTALERTTVGTALYRRAEPFGMAGEAVDGMDVLAVREVVGRAVERARREKAPALIEAQTYRFRGHSMRDPAAAIYRTKAEVEEERKRDPVTLFHDRLAEAGQLTEAEGKAMEQDVAEAVREAVDFAEASPPPPLEWLLTDVYAG